jgi:hypothetical protein
VFSIWPGEGDVPQAEESQEISTALNTLTLMGTITGPWSIARALIKKNGEKDPAIFALYKVNSEISNDVYGYKLVRIWH